MLTRVDSEAFLNRLFAASANEPVMLFKHSLTCGVSDCALTEVERFCRTHPAASVGMVEIQRQRALSDAIAQRTGVRHESPQVILLQGGEVSWHASHLAIDARTLGARLGRATIR